MSTYDIYGFLISVDGPADEIFSERYGCFKTSHVYPRKASLFVKPYTGKEDLPTKPIGALKGIWIPFANQERVLWYEQGVPLNDLLKCCEGLIWWKDKALLHAGAVAKDREAFVFAGGPKVGKSNIVINLVRLGYEYLSDDWLVVGRGNGYPFCRTVHITDLNLRNKAIAKSVLGPKRFLYTPLIRALRMGMMHFPNRYVRYAFEVAKDKCSLNAELTRINAGANVALEARLSRIFYLERKSVEEIKVFADMHRDEFVRRMVNVYLGEYSFLMSEYYKYVYLFGARDARMEEIRDHTTTVLREALEGAELYRLEIPKYMDLTSVDIASTVGLE